MLSTILVNVNEVGKHCFLFFKWFSLSEAIQQVCFCPALKKCSWNLHLDELHSSARSDVINWSPDEPLRCKSRENWSTDLCNPRSGWEHVQVQKILHQETDHEVQSTKKVQIKIKLIHRCATPRSSWEQVQVQQILHQASDHAGKQSTKSAQKSEKVQIKRKLIHRYMCNSKVKLSKSKFKFFAWSNWSKHTILREIQELHTFAHISHFPGVSLFTEAPPRNYPLPTK